MKITSVYSSPEHSTAFVTIELKEQLLSLTKIWRSNSEKIGLFAALAEAQYDVLLFNSTAKAYGEPQSALASAAKRRNLQGVKIVDSVSPMDALEIFRTLRDSFSYCKGWSRLAVELERLESHQTSQALAFLQGVLRADFERSKPSFEVSFEYEQPISLVPNSTRHPNETRTPYGVFRGL
ncbi:MAG: hypothetical protein AAGL17_23430 [Cyanobacteria bacterium J06576_12]